MKDPHNKFLNTMTKDFFTYLNSTNSNNFFNVSIKIFAILDIITTVLIGLFSLLAPNLQVSIFKKEPTLVILIIIVLIMIGLSFRPLTKHILVNSFRFIFGVAITSFILYSCFIFLNWYLNNMEGTFSYRFLTFTKKASLEEKLELYTTLLTQMIEAIKNTHPACGTYIEKSISIYNPSTVKLMSTPYNLIPELAENNILLAKANYYEMINKVTTVPKMHNSNILKQITLWTFVGICALTGAYFIWNFNAISTLTGYLKKTLGNLSDTQTEVLKMASQLRKDVLTDLKASEDFLVLCTVTTKLIKRVTTLEQGVGFFTTEMSNTVNLLQTVIRPCIQATFVGVKTIHPDIASIVFQSLSPEQKDYIAATSKIIFKFK